MKNPTLFLLSVFVFTMVGVMTGCAPYQSERQSKALSMINLDYGDPGQIDAIVSIKPTTILSHLTGRIETNQITSMLYDVFLNSGTFKRVNLGGDKYDFTVSSVVVDLKDLFDNVVHLRVFIQSSRTEKIIYDYKFVGVNLTQSASISNIAEVLTKRLPDIRASLYAELKTSSSAIPKTLPTTLPLPTESATPF